MASQNQKPKSSYHLDHQLLVELANLIETLTTSGNTNLDQECMKKLKRICKKSDGYVDYAHKQLMNQLEQEHAEVRLSSFQVMNELFQRSHHFRELLVAEMQEFLLLTVETDVDFPLPPPKAAAELLKQQTLVAIADWNSKFGKAYKKLGVGYSFLQHCKKVNFDSIIARLEAERARERNRAEQEELRRQENFSKAVQEMTEVIPEIDKCLQETESCYNILFPKNLFTTEPQSSPDDNVQGKEDPLVEAAGQRSSPCSSKLSAGEVNDSQLEGQNIEKNTQEKIAKATNSNVNTDNDSREEAALNGEAECTSRFEGSQCNNGEVYPEDEMELKTNLQASNSAKIISESEEVENVKICDQTGGSEEDGRDGAVGEESGGSELEAGEMDGEEEEEEDPENNEMQSHGVRSFIQNISIDIEIPTEGVMLVEDDNNTDLLSALDDARKLLSSKYLKQVDLWIESFKKANKTETDFFKKCVDMQRSLRDALAKYSDLKIKRMPKTRRVEGLDPDSDDEFEEVPEKEGYEPVIEESLREEYGLPSLNLPSSSTSASSLSQKGKHKMATSSPSASNSVSDQKDKHHLDWHPLLSCEHDPKDPTSSAATLAVLEKKLAPLGSKRPNPEEQDDGTEVDQSDTVSPQKLTKQKNQHLLARAPVIPYGMDLEHWQTPGGVKAPVILRPQTDNRVWTSNAKDEEIVFESGKEGLTRRVFSFTGSFVPVKWTCRAPLPSGKLCERMDRLKCPFHGKIIPRNEDGNPSEPVEETKVKVEKDAAPSEDASEPPLPSVEMPSSSWQDPELLRDIEAATGMDLTIRKGKGKQVSKKGKGKKKGKKGGKLYPGLTDLTLRTNTSRKRLEKRVFNKSAMKRVNAKLTAIDNRRVRDKFSNQFHYALKS